MTLRCICVAWDGTPPAQWALAFAARLARRSGARLIVAHVVAPAEPMLVDLSASGHARRTLPAVASELRADPRLLAGRPGDQLLALARAEHADLLVAGTRPLRGADRLLAPRLRHALLAESPCPVALVRRPPATRHRACVLACGALALAGTLAAELDAIAIAVPAAQLRRACRRHHPQLVVIAPERAHALRRRLNRSPADALVEAVDCPVVIAAASC
jgi:nucleotide-binding universal stress UspA family protein